MHSEMLEYLKCVANNHKEIATRLIEVMDDMQSANQDANKSIINDITGLIKEGIKTGVEVYKLERGIKQQANITNITGQMDNSDRFEEMTNQSQILHGSNRNTLFSQASNNESVIEETTPITAPVSNIQNRQ
jgi:hypothetical protein